MEEEPKPRGGECLDEDGRRDEEDVGAERAMVSNEVVEKLLKSAVAGCDGGEKVCSLTVDVDALEETREDSDMRGRFSSL